MARLRRAATMRVLWAFVVVAVSLAGCAEPVAPAASPTCDEDTCQVQVKEDVAVPLDIRGVIVDETITPVKGIGVTLWQGAEKLASVTTDSNGAFKFRSLDEGFYRITATGEGYSKAETQVDLQDGTPASVRIQVTAIPIPVPSHTLLQWDGFIGCGTYTVFVYVSAGCSILNTVTGNTRPAEPRRAFWDEVMEPGTPPSWVQAEMMWESQQMFADYLWLTSSRVNTDGAWAGGIGSVKGASPVMLSIDPEGIHANGIGQANNVSMPHGVGYMVWTAGPDAFTPGIAFEQPFTLYFSLVYNQQPPEGWMFVKDGHL